MPTVIAGQITPVNLGANDGKMRTVVTLSGRSSGRVQISAREYDATTPSIPSGASEINMAARKSLAITGLPIEEIIIDDSANRGAELLTYAVKKYAI